MEVGDRVRYTGSSFGKLIKVSRGREGQVVDKGPRVFIHVKFDGASGSVAILESNLELI